MSTPNAHAADGQRAEQALGVVRDLFLNAKVQSTEGRFAWGQFLDTPMSSTHYGIYGTSAAIRALVLAGHPVASSDVQSATEQLTLEWKGQSEKSKKKINPDVGITYKVAWLLEGLDPQEAQISNTEYAELFTALLERQLPDGGWGDYWYSEEEGQHSSASSPLATAFAIAALSRLPEFLGDATKRESAVRRLAYEIHNHPELDPAVLSVSLWALSRLWAPSAEEQKLKGHLQAKLLRCLREIRRRGLATTYVFFYDVRGHYHYLHLPVLVVVLLSLLEASAEFAHRKGVRLAADELIGTTVEREGLPCENTGRLSTVDHCWLALLLRRVVNIQPRWRGAPFVDWLLDPRLCWWKGVLAWTALAGMGTVGIWVGVTQSQPVYLLPGVLAEFLFLGLLVNLFTDFLHLIRK